VREPTKLLILFVPDAASVAPDVERSSLLIGAVRPAERVTCRAACLRRVRQILPRLLPGFAGFRSLAMRPSRVHRRLAATMPANVVGGSRLVRVDEAAILAQENSRIGFAEHLIARAHGRLAGLAGAGMLIEFVSAIDAVDAGRNSNGIAERGICFGTAARLLFRRP
jgi:class 3 adenylate cyclase